jgi:hypothetical protein
MPHPSLHLQGFAERKILLLCDIIQACRKVHNDALRRERLSRVRASRKVRASGPAGGPDKSTTAFVMCLLVQPLTGVPLALQSSPAGGPLSSPAKTISVVSTAARACALLPL